MRGHHRTLTGGLTSLLLAGALLPLGGATAQAASVPTCGGVPATIVGTAGDDVLRGTPGNDVIVGLGGNDRLLGLGGSDRLCGGPGNDVLDGGGNLRKVHDDELYVVGDRLRGGPGDDVLKFGGGESFNYDGVGSPDTLDFSGAKRPVKVDLAAGTATGQGRDRINFHGADTNFGFGVGVIGSAFDDTIVNTAPGFPLTVVGGPGNDTVRNTKTDLTVLEPLKAPTTASQDFNISHEWMGVRTGSDTYVNRAKSSWAKIESSSGRDTITLNSGHSMADSVELKGRTRATLRTTDLVEVRLADEATGDLRLRGEHWVQATEHSTTKLVAGSEPSNVEVRGHAKLDMRGGTGWKNLRVEGRAARVTADLTGTQVEVTVGSRTSARANLARGTVHMGGNLVLKTTGRVTEWSLGARNNLRVTGSRRADRVTVWSMQTLRASLLGGNDQMDIYFEPRARATVHGGAGRDVVRAHDRDASDILRCRRVERGC